jgi:peptidyl-prolyl cis-trans isomerase D
MESIIFSLPDGGISKPVRSRYGFHIFQVVSATPPTVKTLNDVRDECMTKLRRSKSQEMILDLLDDLRNTATIEILAK